MDTSNNGVGRVRWWSRVGGCLLGGMLLMNVGACAGGGLRGAVPNSAWLALKGTHVAQVAPGVMLEMPDAPYRARFVDAQGVYFQASLPLVYRTSLGGIVNAVTGGLYVRHDQPGLGRAWTEPVVFVPTMAYAAPFTVDLHQGR